MCLHHILPRCKTWNISGVICYRKPGWRDHIHACHILYRICEIAVCICAGNLVPCQVHRLIHGKICIGLCFKIPFIIRCIHSTYFFLLNITDVTVIGCHLIPVLSFIHQPENCILRQFGKDRRLDPAPVTDHGIFLRGHGLHIGKFVLYRNPCRILLYIRIDICILFYIIQFQINRVILQPHVSVCLIWSRFLRETGWCCIQYLLVFAIPVISLIQISVHYIQRKIYIFS